MGDELLTVTVVCRYRDRVVSTEYQAEAARRIAAEKLGLATERKVPQGRDHAQQSARPRAGP